MSDTGTTPLFVPAGDGVEPTPFARGPWDPTLLHGGAVAALAAEVLQPAVDASYQPARLTVDLVRPVPLRPLAVHTEVVRTGNRLASVRATVTTAPDGKTVATASLLALRPEPLHDPAPNELPPPPDAPDTAEELWDLDPDEEAFIGGAMSFRFHRGGDDTLAGGVAWLHLHRPVLPDAVPSPLARVAAAADVPSAVSGFDGVRYPGVGFINADISVHLHRPLRGEWVRLTSRSRWEPSGIGTVSAAVGDVAGPVGRIGQALILADGLTPA